MSRPNPPSEVVSEALRVYSTRSLEVGLSILNLDSIQAGDMTPALLHCLLAFAIRFMDVAFYDQCREQAVQFYKQSGWRTLLDEICQPQPSYHALQCTCLLIYCDIFGKRKS